tara:strand:- start:49 stop:441 length:393 start_codon:yes stop_codon:yes gene_type:complete
MSKTENALLDLQLKALQLQNELDLVDIIRQEVGDYFRIKPANLSKKTRLRTYVWPRQVAMYFIREFTSFGYLDIAKEFGLINHATAIHSVKIVKQDIEFDRRKENQIKQIQIKILNSNGETKRDQEGIIT